MVESAQAHLGLRQVHVVPTGEAWHRPQRPQASAAHRWAMARLAFADLPGVAVDDLELRRQGPSYTVETVLALQERHPQAQWHLLLGEDQWRSLPAWHRVDELARLVVFVVAQRDAAVPAWAGRAGAEPPPWPHRTLPIAPWPLTATDIRARLRQGLSVDGLLSPEVARYIRDHQLYVPAEESP